MSDVLCAVCNEPWDTYHLRHDAPPWVAPLFYAGAGCEACEGIPPANVKEEETAAAMREKAAHSFVFSDNDAGEGEGLLMGAPRPAWRKPKAEMVWACSGDDCRAHIIRDPDWREGTPGAFVVRDMSYRDCREVEQATLAEAVYAATDDYDGRHCVACVREHTCSECSVWCDGGTMPDPTDPYNGRSGVCEDCYSRLESEAADESFPDAIRETARRLLKGAPAERVIDLVWDAARKGQVNAGGAYWDIEECFYRWWATPGEFRNWLADTARAIRRGA